jgi:hypothetical protein
MSTTVYVEYSGLTLVGAVDGANKAFTLSRSARSGSVFAFINRLFVESTVSGATVTLEETPQPGDDVAIRYESIDDVVVVGASFAAFATDVLELIGVDSPGQTPSDDHIERVRKIFNRLMGQLNIDRHNVLTIAPETFTFTPSKGDYQIGPTGADFPDSARPTEIEKAFVILNSSGTPLSIPLHVCRDPEEYARIRMKTLTSTWPRVVYCDKTVPFSTLKFWPVPTSAYQFELWTWQQLATIDAGDEGEALNFADGYEQALLYNCAVHACIAFQRAVPADIRLEAKRALDAIQAHNAPAPIAYLEDLGESGMSIDYLTGE